MTTHTQTMTFTIFVNLSSHNSAWSYSDLEKVDEIQQVDLNREKVDLYREEEQMEGKAALTGLLEVAGRVPLTAAVVEPKVVAGIQISSENLVEELFGIIGPCSWTLR